MMSLDALNSFERNDTHENNYMDDDDDGTDDQ
jgi:hypothetical protein